MMGFFTVPAFSDILLYSFNWYNGLRNISVAKDQDAVRFGVLGAAEFSPIGLFDPARSHPSVTIVAIAARSLSKAQAQAKAYNIPRAYGSYDELLEQDDIDVVYIPLPVGLHTEWAIKAMRAGKHVLIEKLMTCNESEARAVKQCADETGKVAMEAFHWRFHPSSHVVREIIKSGRYGRLLSSDIQLLLYKGMFAHDNIRFDYGMGGGACTDLAYVFSATRYFVEGGKGDEGGVWDVVKAEPRRSKEDERVDEAMMAEMVWNGNDGGSQVKCKVRADLAVPRILGIIPSTGMPVAKFELEKATITFSNFVCPQYGHSITIEDTVTGVTSTQKHWSFGPAWGAISESWWGTYRYQLEAFVMKLKGEEPPHWIDLEESVGLAKVIDQVYDKARMVRRGIKTGKVSSY